MTYRDAKAGDALPELRPDTISRKTLALFAGASGDHQPSHLDIDAARAKGREDVIAHGMLMMAFVGRMLTDFAPQERLRAFDARFVAVTPVNVQPVCTGRVASVEDGMARLDLQAALPDGKVVVKAWATVDVS
ncbi:MaoC/PaaZ C-terminal domain-containing protein [Antarctobacter sp.]|uniref:MaoC/PaaZ C-terminal domain-containing protein n=1 Tax=Antarctobacter sp. TaxID=1872577 RepID=UPI003A942FC5